ncbi:hydrolase 76 protein [Pestalotiopsis sp. IQ-011]
MACVAAPAAMQRARRELDAAYGDLRLPGLDDLPALPYEVLRWQPVVPLMPQRVLVEDLHFEGYRFPAGTEFLVNSVAVCSRGYARPGEFLTERWLGEGGEAEAGGVRQDLWQFAFSGGRRSCVGYRLAQKVLLVTFARLLYCFDFSRVGDIDEGPLDPFKLGEPFPIKIAVRSEAHAQLIIDESATGKKTQRE